MVTFFPQKLAHNSLVTYLLAVAAVSIGFSGYRMAPMFYLFGIVWVVGFFYLSSYLTVRWGRCTPQLFIRKLFTTSLVIKVIWVFFSYYFFLSQLGYPFEWDAADGPGYHNTAAWLVRDGWEAVKKWEFESKRGYSDVGYELYLTFIYWVFGPNLIPPRLLKALWSSITCVLVYKLAGRNFGDATGRMAGIFCLLMPNLVIYTGLHLKETEMLLLTMAFLERADYLLRCKRYTVGNILSVGILALSLFFFRTVLGAVAILAFFTALVFTSDKLVGTGKKVLLISIGLLFLVLLAGGRIATEVEETWSARDINQSRMRTQQVVRGNKWAQYATGTVMAPMMFTLPFATMVDLGQEQQLLLSGGNFAKNILGIFILIALFDLLFISRKWRDHSLLGAFTMGYLLVISMSAFANAERFHIPTLPCLLIFAAYGVSRLNARNYKFVVAWYFVVFLMEVGWAYFKIGSRGLL